MKRVKINKTLEINYVELFSENWAKVLNTLLCTPYMFNLMAFIQEIFSILPNTIEGKGFVFPYKDKIFDNFRSCPYEGLRVVIIGKEPYNNNNATGIPFAMSPVRKNDIIEDELKLIERSIYKNVNSDPKNLLDETMYSWTYQGVLLLDAASTSEEGSKMAHADFWRQFTREVIKTISKKNKNIIFMLLGEEAQYFEQYIDIDKHHILIETHPQDAIKLNKEWDSTIFNQVNDLLEKIEGKGNIIYW